MGDLVSIFASWVEAAYHGLKPFIVIDQFQNGVMLRLGKYKKTMEPGFYWKIPFADEIFNCSIATETISTASQSVMTKDRVSVFLSGAVKCRVIDAKIYLMEVTDVQNAISDIAQAEIKKIISSIRFEDYDPEKTDNDITKKLRAEAKKWGIYVDTLVLTTFDKGKTIRHITDANMSGNVSVHLTKQ